MSPRRIEKVQNLEANIVIMGGGGGGLAAAEKGAIGIIVLEKLGHLGGNSTLAHGLFACESCGKTFSKGEKKGQFLPLFCRYSF